MLRSSFEVLCINLLNDVISLSSRLIEKKSCVQLKIKLCFYIYFFIKDHLKLFIKFSSEISFFQVFFADGFFFLLFEKTPEEDMPSLWLAEV